MVDNNLDDKVDGVLFEYKIFDIFVPLKQIRHLPKILSEPDPWIRYHELFIHAVITGTQLVMYHSLYKILSD